MPSPSSSEAFLELVRKSEVVCPDRLEAFLGELPELPEKPRDLACLLIEHGLLTNFQAKNLLRGKYKGFVLGKYRVLEQLGCGGSGSVYLCNHMYMRRRVAVKVLPADRIEDSTFLRRFYREARASAMVDHPNIVRAHDMDQEGHLYFLVMEFVDGKSLYDIVQKHGPLDVTRAAHYIRQAAQGLEYLHEIGLVHRDIKPSNLLLDRQGTVKILDLGLARFGRDPKDELTKHFESQSILGTADYLSPEQGRNSHEVDIRSDIYSLGATFYYLLAGVPPFDGGSLTQKLIQHQMSEPKPIRDLRSEVPEEMAELIARMMAKDPANRPQTPTEVIQALDPWTETPIDPPSEDEMPHLSPAALSDETLEWGPPKNDYRQRPPSSGDSGRRLRGSHSSVETRPPSSVSAWSSGELSVAVGDDPRSGSLSGSGVGSGQRLVAAPSSGAEVATSPTRRSLPPGLVETDCDFVPTRITPAEPGQDDRPATVLDRLARHRWLILGGVGVVFVSTLLGFILTQSVKKGANVGSITEAIAAEPPNDPAISDEGGYDQVSGRPAWTGFDASTDHTKNDPVGQVRLVLTEQSGLQAVAVSPDGRWLLTAAEDGVARLWDARTGKLARQLAGHKGAVTYVAFSPDGSRAATCGVDKSVCVWDVQTGRQVVRFTGHSKPVRTVEFTRDGQLVISAGDDGTARLWHIQTRRHLKTYTGHRGPVLAIAASPADLRVVSAGADHTVQMWSLGETTLLHRFTGHEGVVTCVAYSPKASRIVSGSEDGTVRIWDVEKQRALHCLRGHDGAVRYASFTPDGKQVISAADDCTIRVWSAETGLEVRRHRGHAGPVTGVAIRHDARRIYSCSLDQTVREWSLPRPWRLPAAEFDPVDPDTPLGTVTVLSQKGPVEDVRLVNDDRFALICCAEGTNRDQGPVLWDLLRRQPVRRFVGHSGRVFCLDVTADGRFAVTGGRDKTVRLWNVWHGTEIDSWTGHADSVQSVAFSPDGSFVLSGDGKGNVRLWDRHTGKVLWSHDAHTGAVRAVAFAADGGLAASAGTDRTIIVWDAASGEITHRLTGHADTVTSLAFAPRGPYLASASDDRSIRIWNSETGASVRQWTGHGDGVGRIAFSADGRWILSVGHGGPDNAHRKRDNAFRLWLAETGQEVRSFSGHTDYVASVAVSRDGRFALTGGGDKSARLWRLPLPPPTDGSSYRLVGHHLNVESIAVTPDGRTAVSASHDRTLIVWDLGIGQPVRTLEGHTAMVHSVAVTADGRFALSGAADRTVRLWDLEAGREQFTFTGHAGDVIRVALSRDGRFGYSAGLDRTIRVWDLQQHAAVQTLTGPIRPITAFALAAESGLVFAGCQDGSIFVWDEASESPQRQFKTPSPVHSLAVSPNGRSLAIGGHEGTIRIWDLEANHQVAEFKGHSNVVADLAWSPDGRWLLSASDDQTIRLWDLLSSRQLRCLKGHNAPVWCVAFTPNGHSALSGAADGSILWWGLPE